MALNGNTILVFKRIDGVMTPIAATRSVDAQSSAEVIEVSDPTQGEWRKYITGRKSWSVTVNWLVLQYGLGTNNASLTEILNVGETYELMVSSRSGSGGFWGSVILTNVRITATRGNLAQGSFTFQGSGNAIY